MRLDDNGAGRLVNLKVIPLKNLKERCYLILFERVSKGRPSGRILLSQEPAEVPNVNATPPSRNEPRRTASKRELTEARDYAQSLQEQHEAATENFRLRAKKFSPETRNCRASMKNSETSKEELESTNEELITVNEELASRNTELNNVNSDLVNLQSSTKLPIILLGRDLTIRRFSPQAEKQFNMAATDVGRPFGKIRHDLDHPDLEGFINDVIRSVRERECEVKDKKGRWHLLHVRPYLALDNKVDGAVPCCWISTRSKNLNGQSSRRVI